MHHKNKERIVNRCDQYCLILILKHRSGKRTSTFIGLYSRKSDAAALLEKA
jgi:uncharacterized protein YceH (UPF0502 family)